jgi:aminocarboxymuconate-semialdehyde decarboxylase
LVDTMGEDQVVVGSDYPYPLGERPAGRVVREADFLTGNQRDKLLSGNARRYLGMA